MKTISTYPEVNQVLAETSKGITDILGQNLIGLYLFGSLSYGDFNINSSDIDLVAIINEQLDVRIIDQLKQLHTQIGARYPKWAERVECSYTPRYMLNQILPPVEPRAYYGSGVFYPEAPYGNEWIINNYLLYMHGIPLIGPNFKELTDPIEIAEVQKACVCDLFQEWEPKIHDLEWLDNSHYQSYLVLNLCRILYTVMCGATGTKKVSAEWVKKQYGSRWNPLVTTAESWEYGKVMTSRNETIEFLKFVIEEIKSKE